MADPTIISDYILLAPDWQFMINMGRSYKTTITKTKGGDEQRAALKKFPRRSIRYTCVNLQASLTNYGHRKLYNNLHRVVGIPIWVDGTELSAAASINDTTLYVDEHAYREFEEGGKLVLLDVSDPGTYEICTISSLDTEGEIVISSPLTMDWDENTEVFPILPSKLMSAIDVSHHTDRYNQFEIFAEEAIYDVQPATTTTTTSTTTTTTTTSTTTSSSSTSTVTTTTAPPLDWLDDWAFRTEITIDNTNIDSNLTHFPIPLILGTAVGQDTDDVSFIFDELGANSKKIAITKSDMVTQIYGEIELWDSGGEKAVIWVSKSDLILSSSGVTTLYFYYDNTKDDNTTYIGDVTDSPSQNVWDSNFVAVYHLAQDPSGGSGAIKDSTSNLNHGTSSGDVSLIDGPFGKGLDFPGTDDYVNFGSGSSLDDITIKTIETHINFDSYGEGNSGRIVKKSNVNSNGWGLLTVGNTNNVLWFIQAFNGGATLAQWRSPIDSLLVSTDYYTTLVYDNSSSSNDPLMYIDGVSQTVTEVTAPSGSVDSDASSNMWAGAREGVDREYDGDIYELRISNIARSAAWIKATHYSLLDDLISWGAEVPYT